MKTYKLYRAKKDFRLSLTLFLKDRKVSISFNGEDYNKGIKGSFGTTDAEIQEALEKSSNFNIEYKIESSKEMKDPAAPEVEKNKDGSRENTGGQQGQEPSTQTFPTLKDAKAWMIQQFGCAETDIRTTIMATAFAKAKGVTLIINSTD